MAAPVLGDRSGIYNGVFLVILVLLIVGLPLYAGFIGSLVMQDGMPYLRPYLTNPVYAFERYVSLFEYWKATGMIFKGDLPLNLFAPVGGGILICAILLFLARAPLMDFRPFKAKESVHGDAAWASKADMKKAGILKKEGFLLGEYKKGKYMIADGFQHILLFAPTGSGKGVGFVIPNLLFWKESVVCHDIKLENYELTSGYRTQKLKNQCYVWNPADPDGITHCYNPLDWVSAKPGQMVDDVQKIANLILPEQEFWQNEARALVIGVMLYLLAVPEKVKSFGEVVRTLRSDDVVYNLAVVLDTIGKKLHPVAYMNIASFLQKADKERSGVTSTANSSLELWSNPLIDTATASSDFNVQRMKKDLTTVYCGVTPDNLQRLKPLLQVFYQQATDFYTRKMPQPDEPYGILMVMDEFPTLGKMPQFESGIAYFRGYHVRLFLIVQDTQQLKGIYEEPGMNSFLSNSTFRVTFAANNVETANLISQLVGNKTVRQESHNRPKFFDLNPASRTMHVSETARALLLPQEVIQLPRDQQILLIESSPPIKTRKIFYYKDSFFTKRLLPQCEVPTQEPYDPNKKHVPKPKPGDPSAAAEPPKEEKESAQKGTAPAPAAKEPPAKKPAPPAAPAPAAKQGAGTPPPPPALEKKEGAALPPPPAADKEEKKANPFDLPPLPPRPAKKEAAPAAPAASTSAGGDEKKANPFDLPPLPPRPAKKEAAPAAPAAPASAPVAEEPSTEEARAEPPQTGDNPLGLPPIPARPKKKAAPEGDKPFELPPIPRRPAKKASPPPVSGETPAAPALPTSEPQVIIPADTEAPVTEAPTPQAAPDAPEVSTETVQGSPKEEMPEAPPVPAEEKVEQNIDASLSPEPVPAAVDATPVQEEDEESSSGGIAELPPLPPVPPKKDTPPATPPAEVSADLPPVPPKPQAQPVAPREAAELPPAETTVSAPQAEAQAPEIENPEPPVASNGENENVESSATTTAEQDEPDQSAQENTAFFDNPFGPPIPRPAAEDDRPES